MPLVVNGEAIPDRVLEREFLRLSSGLEMDAPHAGAMDPSHLRAAAVRNVVARTLLLQTAAARKLRVSNEEVNAERGRRWGGSTNTTCGSGVTKAIAEDLLLERISADLTRHVPRPSRAQAEIFYRRNQHLYRLAEAVQAAHIVRNVTSSEELLAADVILREAEAELAKGKAFEQVANRYSDCKGVGGSVGWVVRGRMVPEFEDVVFGLLPGQRSGIFRTIFGLHIATSVRRRKEGVRPFDEVRLEIAKRLFAEHRQQALNAAVASLEAESDIRFTEESTHA